MTRAFDLAGNLVHVDQVTNGLSCQCVCVVCRSPLVAKQGQEKAHHFAHDGEHSCDWSGETELHLMAKEVIKQDCSLSVTVLSLDGKPHKVKIPFIEVKIEASYGGFTPDLVAYSEDGEAFLIEICVTHPCEQDKLVSYRRQALNAVEVILPLSSLGDCEVLTEDVIRDCISNAVSRCISMNPLSEFFRTVVDSNNKILKQQGEQLRRVRTELGTIRQNVQSLRTKHYDLSSRVHELELIKAGIDSRAHAYRQELNREIEGQRHVIDYRREAKKYQTLTANLKADFDSAVEKANRDIEQYERDLARKAKDHYFNREIDRLRSEVDRLDELRKSLRADGDILKIDLYIQKLDLRYENHVADLEHAWSELKRQYPQARKPECLASSNRRLSDLPLVRPYRNIRG